MGAVIIGAGIAGLTAAYELVKAGERPTLIEPRAVGGMISSLRSDGFTLERGPNVLVERPDVMLLVRELGLIDRLRYPVVKPYGQYVWFNGGACKVPAGIVELICSPLVSAGAKLALPMKVALPNVMKPQSEDESVERFFSRLIGKRASRAMLDPVLKGIYGGNVDELSARTIFHGLWDAAVRGRSLVQYLRERPKGSKPSIFVIEGGIQVLVDALWQRIESKVDLVRDDARELKRLGPSLYRVETASGNVFETERCIVTVAGANLATLIQTLEPNVSQLVSKMRYASLTVVHLSAPRSHSLIKDAFGMLCPAGMPEHFLGVMFNSQIFPGMAPPDRHLLTVILGGAQAGGEAPDLERARREVPRILESLLGLRDTSVLGTTHWQHAIPQLVVGHHLLVEALDASEKDAPGLAFAGVDRGGVGVSDRIRIAREAVERSAKGYAMRAAS
jgi:oxygen-dependent protoporphyrinogen oxidase